MTEIREESSAIWNSTTTGPQRRQWHPTPVLLPGKSHGWRSLVGCSSWGREESDTTDRLHFHFSFSCIGEGNGNPLQYSCLDNPRDRGAWWAAVYRVAQSGTRLKRLRVAAAAGALESPLDCKEIEPGNPKGSQPWISIGRTDAEAEAPILQPTDAKSQLTGKDPDAGKDWGQEEEGATEAETVGWHHWLNGHEFEQTWEIVKDREVRCCSACVAKGKDLQGKERKNNEKWGDPMSWLSRTVPIYTLRVGKIINNIHFQSQKVWTLHRNVCTHCMC